MIEAGPRMAEYIIQKKLADILIAFQSPKESTFTNGVGFSASMFLSKKETYLVTGKL